MGIVKMFCANFVIFLLLIGCAEINTETVEKSVKIPRTYSDVLAKNIKREKWDIEDKVCFNQILSTLQNEKNFTLWAVWMLDSMQFPTGVLYGSKYQLGNYDECLDAPWLDERPELRTKYCLADVKLSNVLEKSSGVLHPYVSAENYIKTKTKHNRTLSTITWGVCVPASCSAKAISSVLKALLKSSTFSSFSDPEITVDECEVAGQEHEYGSGVREFWYLLLLLLIVAIASTWYLAKTPNADPESTVTNLAKCFCMNKNAYDLVKPSPEDIPALNGMRALTAIILVFTHQVFFLNSGAVVNGMVVEKDLDQGFFLIHTDLFTDTFLMMSGLLLARGLLGRPKMENPVTILWKRYIRLIVPMGLMVFYMAVVSIHMGSGPLWHRLAGHEQETCARNWWLSLLMLNNYVRSEDMCYIILWYIPVDFHLTILGVLIIYFSRSYPHLGRTMFLVVTILAVLLPAVGTYWNQLPATIVYNVETMIDIRKNTVFNSTYIRSHYRIPCFLVGLGFGYLLTKYKPALHRNTISKKWSIIGFITMFIIAWIPMASGGLFYTRPYNVVEAALYAGTNRIVWVTALCALVAIIEYGDLAIVTGLLSWSAWVPLSRLSYGLYLTHPAIIQYNLYTTRSPLREHVFTQLSDSFGPTVIGYIFSLLIWLLIQAPVSNLTNLYYSKSKRKPLSKSADEMEILGVSKNKTL